MRWLQATAIACLAALCLPAPARRKVEAPPAPAQQEADAPPAPVQAEIDARPATAAGDAWLALVDAGRYGESWEEASATFKEAVGRVRWEVAAQQARGKVGGVVRRKLRSARSAVNLPNAPPGEYVVIEHETRFQNRPLAIETVTLMKQKDGRWRVAGYFIH